MAVHNAGRHNTCAVPSLTLPTPPPACRFPSLTTNVHKVYCCSRQLLVNKTAAIRISSWEGFIQVPCSEQEGLLLAPECSQEEDRGYRAEEGFPRLLIGHSGTWKQGTHTGGTLASDSLSVPRMVCPSHVLPVPWANSTFNRAVSV